MERFNRERLIYFLLMIILAMIITYLIFSGDFTSKEKKSLVESTQIYNENIKTLQSLKMNDSLMNKQLDKIKEKEFILIKQIENGQISAEEARKKYDELNDELQKINQSNALRVGILGDSLRGAKTTIYTRDTTIDHLRIKLGLKPLTIDNTDYEQLNRERKRALQLEEEKKNLASNINILENEKLDIRTRLDLYKFYSDSLNVELKKFPTPRVFLENIQVQPVERQRIRLEVPDGTLENDVEYFKITFDISSKSRCAYGKKYIKIIYCDPEGKCPTENRTTVEADFEGQTIPKLTAIIRRDKFIKGIHSFKLIDDNMKVGAISYTLPN